MNRTFEKIVGSIRMKSGIPEFQAYKKGFGKSSVNPAEFIILSHLPATFLPLQPRSAPGF